MSDAATSLRSAPTPRTTPSPRPKYYDLNLLNLPPPGIVSILHRISGAVLFLAIPVLLCIFQGSLSSEADFKQVKDFFAAPLTKLAAIGLAYLYAHHFFAGIRYLLLDLHIGIAKEPSRMSAYIVLVLGLVSALAFGASIW